MQNLSPQRGKKGFYKGGAIFCKDAGCGGRLGVENLFGVASVAAFRVVGAPHHAGDLRPADRSGAHDARLDRDVKFYEE